MCWQYTRRRAIKMGKIIGEGITFVAKFLW